MGIGDWYREVFLKLVFGILITNFCQAFLTSLEDESFAKGCYLDDVNDPLFTTSAGDSTSISPSTCSAACEKEKYLYCGIQDGKFCFCSNALPSQVSHGCNAPCLDNSPLGCGGSNGLTSVFKAKTNEDITGLKLSADKLEVVVLEKVTFNYNVTSGTNVRYKVDCGDGYLLEVDNYGKIVEHAYLIPGQYYVTVYASDDNSDSVSDSITISVVQQLGNLLVDCPAIVDPSDTFLCNMSMLKGEAVTMSINTSDSSSLQEFPVSGTRYRTLGHSVPQGDVMDIQDTTFGPLILMPETVMDSEGYIVGFEVYVVETGTINFLILTPSCTSGEYCYSTSSCGSSCSAAADEVVCSEVYYPVTDSCQSGSSPKRNLWTSYRQHYKYVATISKIGYNYFEPEVIKLYPGDVLAFEVVGQIIVGHRNLTASELSLVNSGDKFATLVDGPWMDTNQAHFVAAIVSLPAVVMMEHTYNVTGNYSVGVVCQDGLGKASRNSSLIIVAQLIRSVNISLETSYWRVGAKVNITVIVIDASDFTIEWDFGDESEKKFQNIIGSIKESTYFEEHVYMKEGFMTVTVTACNLLDNKTDTHNIYIQFPVLEPITLSSDTPILCAPGNVNFTLSFPSSNPNPSNITIVNDWGVGYTSVILFPVVNNGSITISHDYTTSGKFDVVIVISNEVSNVTATTEVTIYEPIKGLSASLSYWTPKTGKSFLAAFGKNGDTVPPNANVSIEITKQSGTVVGYSLFNEDGTLVLNSTSNIFYFGVSEMEPYFLTVYAWCPLQEKSASLKLRIVIDQIIDDTHFYADDFLITTDRNETKEFQVSIGVVTMDMCMVVIYGDETIIKTVPEAYGKWETCARNFTEDEINFVDGTLKSTMNFLHVYKNRGLYNFNVTLFSNFSISQSMIGFTVTNFPCEMPKMDFENGHNSLANAKVHYRSEGFSVETESSIHCRRNVTTSKLWKIYLVNEFGLKIKLINTSKINSERKSILFVPPLFLSYGYYKFVYILTITVDGMDTRFPWSHSIYTFIKIVPSPLMAVIIGGSNSEILRGAGQIVHLNPAKFSVDPDFIDDKNFSVSWFCRRIFPNEENDTIIDGKHASKSLISVPLVNNSKPSTDNGGCFGTGFGELDLPNNKSWKLNMSLLYATEITYEIKVTIKKDVREGDAKLLIKLVDGMPPEVVIRCQSIDVCFPIPNGYLFNPTSRLSLSGECVGECHGPLSYIWNVYDGYNNVVSEASKYIPENTYEEMIIEKEFFGNFSERDLFHVELTMTGPTGSGRSSVFLQINRPPENGSCIVTPISGRALLDLFFFQCSGWMDPEKYQITKYIFYIKTESADGKTILSSDVRKMVEVVLPYGSVQVMVDIIDAFGAFTTVNVTTLNTTLPSYEDYVKFTECSFVSNLVGGGDQDRIVQVFLAIASIENANAYNVIANSSVYNETNSELTKEKIQKSDRISWLLQGIETITTGTLIDLEMVSSAMSSIVGVGNDMDVRGKQVTTTILDNFGSMLENITLRSPQEGQKFAESAVAVMGALANSIASTMIDGIILPSDFKYVNEIDYDTDIGDNYDFEMPKTMEMMQREAIVENTAYNGGNQIEKLEQVFDQIGQKILSEMVPNENPVIVDTINGVNAMFGRFRGTSVSGRDFKIDGASFILPDFCVLSKQGAGCLGNESIGVQTMELPSILQSYGKHVGLLATNTKTIKIQLYDKHSRLMTVKNLTEPVDIFIPRMTNNETSSDSPPLNVTPIIKWYELMVYHQFNVTKVYSSVNVEITPADRSCPLYVFIRFKYKPTLTEYDYMSRIVDISMENGTYDLFLSNLAIKNQTGQFYVGIAELNLNFPNVSYESFANLTSDKMSSNITTTYTIRMFTSGCYYFDRKRNSWQGDGCWVNKANYSMTHCKCNHLTTFGSGFFITPSTVDFDYAFAHPSFNDNLTIYLTLIITFVFFIIMMIWASWKDRKDLKKLVAVPLPDNHRDDKYIYEILVSTGSKQDAATNSQVYFIVSGEQDETEVRRFGRDQQRLFRKGEIDVFVMTVTRPLGPLNYMRLWHDNSGKGKYGSWYLNYIVIRDVQTGVKFEFVANNWFAVEQGDGTIDRVLPVAGEEQLTEFGHLFAHTSTRGIADNHLWFSVFLRPPRSRFTRVQRVGCCVAFLYLSMLVNAMWYNTVNKSPHGNIFSIGPFSISIQEIGVGLISNIIVFLPNFIIVYFFRKARPRKLRSSRIEEALNKQRAKNNSRTVDGHNEEKVELKQFDELEKQHDIKASCSQRAFPRRKKFTLPWVFQILAWFMVFLSIGSSVFFLWSYGVTFGNEKTKKWVIALVISFFSSVLITEPIKLFLVAMLFSAICKKADNDEDDADEDEEDPVLLVDKEYLSKVKRRTTILDRQVRHQPPNPDVLNKAREIRLKEIKMWAILREIIGYLLFLWILVVVSYGNRDPNCYHLKQTLSKAFIRHGKQFDFMEMKSTAQFWNWTREVLIPKLRADNLYNNRPPFGYKGFLNDQVNRLMGHAIMRQIRINRDECVPPEIMENVSHPCSGTFTKYINEDHHSYDFGWKRQARDDDEPVDRISQAFRYRRADSLDGIPFIGNLDVYSGGGYVYEITGKTNNVIEKFRKLEELNWIDRFTRAVLIEFSVYNTQVNLFGVCYMILEFVPGGGFFQDFRFDGIRLLQYHDDFGLLVVICEIAFVLFVLYFMVHEFIEIYKYKGLYFTSYWNLAELTMVTLSLAAGIVYGFRMAATKTLLNDFNRTKGNKYINLQFVYLLDQTFGYLISFVVFIATVKFIKLLRFNKRIGILSSTLAHAWAELAIFGGFFLVIFFAFVQLFYLLMSATSLDFASFLRTIEHTFSMMLNKFNFKEISRGCPILGPLAFFVFALMTSIVLINLFLTIIIRSFKNVAHDVFKQPNDYEIVDFILDRFKSFVGLGVGLNRVRPHQPTTIGPLVSADNGDDCKAKKLSQRVDLLLGYINDEYFDGKINLNDENRQNIYTDAN